MLFRSANVREWYMRCALIVCGVVIAAPGIIGLASKDAVTKLYSVAQLSGIDAVLLQHRAALLLAVGVLLIAAVTHKTLRLAACIVALLSNISFILLVWLTPYAHSALAVIALVDVALSILLIIALALVKDTIRR